MEMGMGEVAAAAEGGRGTLGNWHGRQRVLKGGPRRCCSRRQLPLSLGLTERCAGGCRRRQEEERKGMGLTRGEEGKGTLGRGSPLAPNIRKIPVGFPNKEKPEGKRNKTSKLVGINSKENIPWS